MRNIKDFHGIVMQHNAGKPMIQGSFIARTGVFVASLLMAVSARAESFSLGPSTCPALAPYVAGVDAYGRPVAPADVEDGRMQVYARAIAPEIASKNQQLNGVQVFLGARDSIQSDETANCQDRPSPGRAPSHPPLPRAHGAE